MLMAVLHSCLQSPSGWMSCLWFSLVCGQHLIWTLDAQANLTVIHPCYLANWFSALLWHLVCPTQTIPMQGQTLMWTLSLWTLVPVNLYSYVMMLIVLHSTHRILKKHHKTFNISVHGHSVYFTFDRLKPAYLSARSHACQLTSGDGG